MGDELRYTELIGSQNGLKLVLNINQDDYTGILTDLAGIRLSIHNAYSVPFPEDSGINISPGMTTSISLRNNKIIRTQEDCQIIMN